jgi:uncharacterized membrane protein (Fun14 family)
MSASRKPENAPKRALPPWKKLLLAVAGVFVLVGAVLGFAHDKKTTSGDGATVQSTGGEHHYLSGEDSTGAGTGAEGTEAGGVTSYSPFFVKGGLSFFAGFAIGFALRAFFKISLLVIGLILLAIFGLSYAGVDVIHIDWTKLDAYFDQFAAAVKEQASGFKTFVTGSLPSAALATLGLLTGFKR